MDCDCVRPGLFEGPNDPSEGRKGKVSWNLAISFTSTAKMINGKKRKEEEEIFAKVEGRKQVETLF